MRRIVLVGVLLLGACAAKEGSAVSAEKATTTAPIGNTTEGDKTTTTEKLPDSFPIGTKVETARGNFFTLWAYEQPIVPPEFFEPDAGNEYAAADVEFCRGPNTDELLSGIGPGDFELQMGDNTRRTFDMGAKEPALHYTDVPSEGDCLRGWVTYQVPAGIRPKYLIVLNTEPLVKFAL